jgi:hypothetical protein
MYLNLLKTVSNGSKYEKLYQSIVESAKFRVKNTGMESHHILPKSFGMGGETDINNIVHLTYREHFICHKLLIKMVSSTFRAKMIFALWQMANRDTFGVVNSRDYVKCKYAVSNLKKLLWQDPDYREKMYIARSPYYNDPVRQKEHSECIIDMMKDPVYKEACVRPMIDSHKNIDHTTKEWTERSFNSQESIAKSSATAKLPENREKARQRELNKGAETLSKSGRDRRNKQIEDGVLKYGSKEAYHAAQGMKVRGRVKIRHQTTGQIKVLHNPDMSILIDWELVGRKGYIKTGPNPKTWYYNPSTTKIQKYGISELVPTGFVAGRGPKKYWSTEYQSILV